MNIVEPDKQSNLVRVGNIRRKSAFKDSEGAYFIVLDMQENYFECWVRPETEIDYDPIWVFNVQTDTLAIFNEDEMVEPVELEIHVAYAKGD